MLNSIKKENLKVNTNKFKQDMRKGLGRCVIALKNAKSAEPYRDAVLWGCTHSLAYDAQCEGAHSLQLYDMINCFSDKAPFFAALGKGLEAASKNGSWDSLKCSEVLAYFAADGEKYALEILENMYKRLLYTLMKKRAANNNNAYECFENIAVALVSNENNGGAAECRFLDIAADMGMIAAKSIVYRDETYDWFYAVSEEKIGKARLLEMLDKAAAENEYIGIYRKLYTASEKEWNAIKEKRIIDKLKTPEEIYRLITDEDRYFSARGEFFGIVNSGKTRYIKAVAQMYGKGTNDIYKARLLGLFRFKDTAKYLEFDVIKRDALSENTELSEIAFEVMGKIKSKKALAFALECADNGIKPEMWLSMLIKNYEPKYEGLLINNVKKVRVNFTGGKWHSIFSDIRRMFLDEEIKFPPEELLMYMYEKGYCSLCRFGVVKEMDRRGMLTRDILYECLYDSYDDTREFAENKLKYGGQGFEIK